MEHLPRPSQIPSQIPSFLTRSTPSDQTSVIDRFFGDGLETNEERSPKGNLIIQIILKSLPELVWIICAGVFCSEYPGLDKHYDYKQQHSAPDEDHYSCAWRILSMLKQYFYCLKHIVCWKIISYNIYKTFHFSSSGCFSKLFYPGKFQSSLHPHLSLVLTDCQVEEPCIIV